MFLADRKLPMFFFKVSKQIETNSLLFKVHEKTIQTEKYSDSDGGVWGEETTTLIWTIGIQKLFWPIQMLGMSGWFYFKFL